MTTYTSSNKELEGVGLNKIMLALVYFLVGIVVLLTFFLYQATGEKVVSASDTAPAVSTISKGSAVGSSLGAPAGVPVGSSDITAPQVASDMTLESLYDLDNSYVISYPETFQQVGADLRDNLELGSSFQIVKEVADQLGDGKMYVAVRDAVHGEFSSVVTRLANNVELGDGQTFRMLAYDIHPSGYPRVRSMFRAKDDDGMKIMRTDWVRSDDKIYMFSYVIPESKFVQDGSMIERVLDSVKFL